MSRRAKGVKGNTPIGTLADIILGDKEEALAWHLSVVMGDDKYDALTMLAVVLPKYWEAREDGKGRSPLPPRSVFRRLYYVHSTGGMRGFHRFTRDFLADVAGHLEGCLFHLYYADADPHANPNLTMGALTEKLRATGAISQELAAQLQAYNRTVNVSSKHFESFPLPENLDERTFSVYDAALALVMMRKLSMQLFPLLRQKGLIGDVDWPPFDDRWLQFFPLVKHRASDMREE